MGMTAAWVAPNVAMPARSAPGSAPTRECPRCDGDGVTWEGDVSSTRDEPPHVGRGWIDCGECAGTGRVPIPRLEPNALRRVARALRALEFYCQVAGQWTRLVEAMANGFAAGVVAHLQANAVVTIDASTSVGRLPSSFSANAAIQPPAAPVALSIT